MCEEYHKIQTIYKRDMTTRGNPIIPGAYTYEEFEYLKDTVWQWTEKVDGTNVRVLWDGEDTAFGGRTDNAQMPTFLLRRLQELFGAQHTDKLINTFGHEKACMYGEGYGARIQKGGGNYKRDGVDFVLFDVKIGDWWLRRPDVEGIAADLGVRVVPIVGEGTLAEATGLVREGFPSAWGVFDTGFLAEGLVLRPKVELFTRSGHRIISKIKHRDFIHENSKQDTQLKAA